MKVGPIFCLSFWEDTHTHSFSLKLSGEDLKRVCFTGVPRFHRTKAISKQTKLKSHLDEDEKCFWFSEILLGLLT